jgi:hypothetical protein
MVRSAKKTLATEVLILATARAADDAAIMN